METQGQLRQLRQLSKYLIKFLYCYVQQIADNVLVQNLKLPHPPMPNSLCPIPHSLLFQLKG